MLSQKSKKVKNQKRIIRIEDLQQWTERNYFEGRQDDVISKQDLRLHYSGSCGISDEDRPVLLSLLGNILSKYPPFLQVTRCLPHGNIHGGKHSAFKFLKKKDQVTKTSKCQHSQNCKDDKLQLSKDINDRCTRERATPAFCIQENPQHDAPMCSEHSGSVKEEKSLLLDDLGDYYSPVNDSFDQAASLGSERWDENPSIVDSSHDCITLDKPTSKVPLKKTT